MTPRPRPWGWFLICVAVAMVLGQVAYLLVPWWLALPSTLVLGLVAGQVASDLSHPRPPTGD